MHIEQKKCDRKVRKNVAFTQHIYANKCFDLIRPRLLIYYCTILPDKQQQNRPPNLCSNAFPALSASASSRSASGMNRDRTRSVAHNATAASSPMAVGDVDGRCSSSSSKPVPLALVSSDNAAESGAPVKGEDDDVFESSIIEEEDAPTDADTAEQPQPKPPPPSTVEELGTEAIGGIG